MCRLSVRHTPTFGSVDDRSARVEGKEYLREGTTGTGTTTGPDDDDDDDDVCFEQPNAIVCLD